jgi:hypothetical protein
VDTMQVDNLVLLAKMVAKVVIQLDVTLAK